MPIHDGSVTAGKHRNLESELADAGAHCESTAASFFLRFLMYRTSLSMCQKTISMGCGDFDHPFDHPGVRPLQSSDYRSQ